MNACQRHFSNVATGAGSLLQKNSWLLTASNSFRSFFSPASPGRRRYLPPPRRYDVLAVVKNSQGTVFCQPGIGDGGDVDREGRRGELFKG